VGYRAALHLDREWHWWSEWDAVRDARTLTGRALRRCSLAGDKGSKALRDGRCTWQILVVVKGGGAEDMQLK
jgi:hypothetical protein